MISAICAQRHHRLCIVAHCECICHGDAERRDVRVIPRPEPETVAS